MILDREPVAVASAVRLVLVALAAFGLGLDEAQIVAVVAALEALLGLFARNRVTPVPAPERGFSQRGAVNLTALLLVLILVVLLVIVF